MPLPYDEARCLKVQKNWNCPLRKSCARRLDKGREEYQPYTQYPGGPECDGFVDVKDVD